MERPRLRPVEIFPLRDGTHELLGLRDPQGLTDRVVAVSAGAGVVLQCLDGKHTVAQIQKRVKQATGQLVAAEVIEKFIRELDEALFLESPRLAAHLAAELASYRQAAQRPAAHAGQSYPATAAGVRRSFAKHWKPPRGPGADGVVAKRLPAALVIPHIDLRRGGPAFAWAYAQLGRRPAVDTFVVLGVAHAPTNHRFVGTKKDFATPLGTVPTDVEFMETLAGKLPFDLFADELAHRREHSVEFQAVYLRYALAETTFRIAPLLTGSFHDLLAAGADPLSDREVAAFVNALRETIAESGRRVCVLASVDLAHVGARFGDEFTVNAEVRRHLEMEDRRMLSLVEACDARELLRFIYEEEDRRRVDAWPTLYTLLHVCDVAEGRLLHYDQSFEQHTNSVVTYASLRLDP
jgi:AmmeMemoRadiSam system protein B